MAMGFKHRWLTHALVAVPLFFAGHVSQAQVAQVAAGSIPPGQARIWFYRDYEPFVSRNFALVDLNGARVASLPPAGGPVYRDVAPGHYRITPESWGTDINQSKEVDLAPGQEIYARSLPTTPGRRRATGRLSSAIPFISG
jgi:hypothetical protein